LQDSFSLLRRLSENSPSLREAQKYKWRRKSTESFLCFMLPFPICFDKIKSPETGTNLIYLPVLTEIKKRIENPNL